MRSKSCLCAHFTDLVRLRYKPLYYETPGARVNLKMFELAAAVLLVVMAYLLEVCTVNKTAVKEKRK